MSALADPWVGYEGDVKQSVEEFRSSFGKFEALQRDGRPDEVQHAQKELLSQLKTLNWCGLPFCPARPSPVRRDLCYLNASCRSAGTWTISATRSRRWRRTAPSTSWTTWSSSGGGPLRSPLLLALALLVPLPCPGHALPGPRPGQQRDSLISR